MLSELKKLGKHALIYGTGILLGKAVGFFLIPLYTHFLKPKDYGILELLDLTGYIIAYILGLGLDSALLRYYSLFEDDKDKRAVISTAFLLQLVLSMLLFFLLYNSRYYLSSCILGSTIYVSLFPILFVSLFLASLNGLLKVALRAQQKSMEFTLVSVIYTAVALSLNILFVAFLKLGIKGILYSTAITSALSLLYLIPRIITYCGLSFHLSKLKRMLKYGVPLVPAGIFVFILNWSDRYVLRLYCDMDIIGLYSLGYKIGMIVAFLIAGSFHLIWSAYMFEVQKKDNAKEIYARVTTYFILLICTLGLAISIFSREIILIMADSAYLNAHKVVPLIVLAMTFMTTDNVFRTGILLRGKTVYLAISTALAAIINIALNFLFIPNYGMMGAALATSISFFIYSIVILFFAQRAYYINFEFLRLSKIALAAIITFGLSSFVSIENLSASIIVKSCVLCIFPVLLYISRLLLEEEAVFIKRRWRILHKVAFHYYKSSP